MSKSQPHQEQQSVERTVSSTRTEVEPGERGEGGELEPLPLDQIFDLLKNERRRLVLSYLKDHDARASTSDLAEFVAAHETGKPVSQISSTERKRAYVGLYQCHLPKMDSMGVIEFNKPRGVVTLGHHADVVDPYLEVAEESGLATEAKWVRRYLALAGTSLVLLLLSAVAGGIVVDLAFAGVVGALGGTSVIHWLDTGHHGTAQE